MPELQLTCSSPRILQVLDEQKINRGIFIYDVRKTLPSSAAVPVLTY